MNDGDAATVYRAYIDAEQRRDLAAMQELLAPDVLIELNGRPALGSADEDSAAMAQLFHAYPDYQRQIIEIIADNDRAAVRWRMIGRPRDDLRDRLEDLDVAGCSIVEVKDGRITQAHVWSPSGALEAIID